MAASPAVAAAGQQRAKRVPIRTCVACRTSGGKRGLLRVVRLPEGAGVALDPTGKKSGRGAYVCPTGQCVALALKKKSLERSLKTPLPEEAAEALRAAVAAADAAEQGAQATAPPPPPPSATETAPPAPPPS